ncbi:uncharacterized protein EV420DRAFT_1701746 [Desarmillaria tabescens]|uniref:Uncharacterized protein n=1 Tax=Armillaria tabescens TaxID=1929756 RepID=A0AA39K0F7_ARMTA|nr:uncharacterized protein EV420DRAFT_1701746 [Desarmillaria tabescens]KAK0452204.1 hypothetical protein EV420DRAFT_1701746 [Desarmillaria tabescens]
MSQWMNGIPPEHVYSLPEYVDLLQSLYLSGVGARQPVPLVEELDESGCMNLFTEVAIKGTQKEETLGINLMTGSHAGRLQTCDLYKDFDSLLGIYTHTPYFGEARLPAISRDFISNLSKEVHFRYDFQTPEDVCTKPHLIPNSCILEFGTNSKICIMFPQAYYRGRGNSLLTDEECAHLYAAVTVAHRYADPLSSHERPSNWESALHRANPSRHSKKGAHVHRLNLPEHATGPFLDKLLDHLNGPDGEPWAKNALYYIERRGLKELNRHRVNDLSFLESSEQCLEQFMGDIIPPDAALGDILYIDTALEIGQHGAAVLPRTSQHATFITRALDIPQEQSSVLATHDFKGYQRQPFALLGEASGCRISYHHGAGNHQAVFIQVYTSDKALVAHASSVKNAIYLKPSHVFFRKANRSDGSVPEFIQTSCDVLASAAEDMDIVTRIEARVPYAAAHAVFQNITGGAVHQLLTLHDRKVVWGYKFYRAKAYGQVLALQTTRGQEKMWSKLEAAGATLYVIWCFNATLAFDQPWGADEDLVLCCAEVHKDPDIGSYPLLKPRTDDNGQIKAPVIWDGAVWIRNIALPPDTSCPRFQKGTWTVLKHETWKYFLDGHSLNELVSARQPNTRQPHPNYIPGRKGPTHPAATSAIPEGRIAILEYPVNNQPYDIGEDLSLSEIDEPEEESTSMPDTLAKIINDTICGVMQSIGSRRNQGAAYCKVAQDNRSLFTTDTFHDLNLGAYFDAVWVDPRPAAWIQTIKLTFPHADIKLSKAAQGYRTNQGWVAFGNYRDRITDAESAKTVVNQVQKEMRDWIWFPYTQKERQVDYKKGSNSCVYWPVSNRQLNSDQRAIRIAVNPKYVKKLRFDNATSPVLGIRTNTLHPASPPSDRDEVEENEENEGEENEGDEAYNDDDDDEEEEEEEEEE